MRKLRHINAATTSTLSATTVCGANTVPNGTASFVAMLVPHHNNINFVLEQERLHVCPEDL
jgi:hypothetical protein